MLVCFIVSLLFNFLNYCNYQHYYYFISYYQQYNININDVINTILSILM